VLPHYATFLPRYKRVFFPGSKEARFSNILTLSEAERPIMLVGVMRNNTPELVPLWGPARHLDPPYARTTVHAAPVVFCRDVVHENLPASAMLDCNWLVTKSLELIKEDAFVAHLDDCAPGADVVNELAADARDEHYTARAVVVLLCLVAELFRCPRNPVAAWRLLRARAAELGLTESCSGMWLLLRALASAEHREDSCVPLALMDGNAHFVSARRSTLESILPALAATESAVPPPSSSAGDAVGTATVAAAIEAATRPAASKIVLVEEKWPQMRPLLLTGVPR
jgi:hypothetical protein